MTQKTYVRLYIFFLIVSVLLAACSQQDHIYKIGVSQCSVGIWRSKVNNEMLAAQHLFDQDVDVDIVDCYDQSDDQIRQIDSLVAAGIDLLVVAPNDYKIAPALKRAKDKGIPIVLFDRMVESDDFTAFIGGSNVAIGELAANYATQIAAESEGHNVLEIAALQNTSPARERHQGFETVMKQHPEVNYRCIISNWGYYTSLKEVPQRSKGETFDNPWQAFAMNDYVFRYTDVMMMRAEAMVETGDLEGARTIINAIRQRAKNSIDKHIGYAKDQCEIALYPASDFATQEQARSSA